MLITEDTIRRLTTAQSYDRGEDYYSTHAVTDIQKRGQTLMAEVEGSHYETYHIIVELSENDILSTSCTCPYDWGGVCKHVVAVLLTYIRQPKHVDEHPAVEELLAHVHETQLREVLIDLLTSEPHLIDRVETKLAMFVTTTPKTRQQQQSKRTAEKSTPPPVTPIDPTPFRRQMQQLLRGSGYRDYDEGWDISNQAEGLFQRAQPFLEAGDGRNALLALEAVMEPFIESWYEYDHEGEVGEVFINIAPLFTEAILSADLSKEERKAWVKKFKKWDGETSDYGVDGAFDAAVAAAEHGWDDPPLQAVLQGNITNQGAWADDAPEYADDLAVARLNVLARQGRMQEYLYLAEAEGQTGLYLTMLVQLGRGADAVAYARQYPGTTDDVFALAQALYQENQPDEAISIGDYGLTLPGEPLLLARWLRDVAHKQAQPEVALRAAQAAFRRSYALEDYQAVKTLSGVLWTTLKPELLAQLTAAPYGSGRIDIYLAEGMFDEAIQLVERDKYAGYHTVEKVVDAVWQTHPDWAIRHCKAQAEPIMEAKKSQHYHHAIRWLDKAGHAYLGANRQQEWHAYLDALIETHRRKTSLRPQLERLRRQ